ncbi:MAG: hypothetical protein RRY13_05880 [Akkermansia sp.]
MNYPTNPIMNPTSCLILQKLLETYRPEEFPALLHQCESWAKTQPLNGLHILDATPVFTNTCAKYAALLAAGASLTICVSTSLTSGIPHDQALLPMLQQWGIPTIDPLHHTPQSAYDIIRQHGLIRQEMDILGLV